MAHRQNPQWEVIQGRSRFCCYEPDEQHARRSAAIAGFKRPDSVRMIRPGEQERDRERLALLAAAPMRAKAGHVIERQHDASALPLFEAANEPRLL